MLFQRAIHTAPEADAGQIWHPSGNSNSIAHELLMKMLQENAKIKIIYRGNLLLVYIYTKNSNSLIHNISHQNL